MATNEPDASGQEDPMTWLTLMLRNGTGLAFLGDYLSYGIHALWLLVPFILIYFPLLTSYCNAYLASVLLYIYKKKNDIQEHPSSKSWDKARNVSAWFINSFAKIWYGYEIIGMENLPKGPGLIVFYHAPVESGYFFFIHRLYMLTGRFCYTLCDHLVCHLPGIKLYLELSCCSDFNKAECVEILKKGNLLGIAPGGLREVNFAANYRMLWGNRTGFAQVALEAKVPIIPMFTQNVCESYRRIGNTRLTRYLYERNRWLVLPVFGGFPVKLRTYIGEPIPYDPNITAKELAEKTKTAIENLIDRYQKRPESTLRALLERFHKHHKGN